MAAETSARSVESSSRSLPAAVYLLAFSLFAMGSAEFLLAGVLPSLATDLDVPLSSAGFLITAFALGVVVGGPAFAMLSLRWPRRATLAATQCVFAVSLAAGLLGGYETMLVSRVIAGVAYVGFFAVASVTAVSLVPPDRAARASGVVVSGLSAAMAAGGPGGTLLSHLTQWRGGFWLVAALSVAGAVACLLGVPAAVEPAPGTSRIATGILGELAVMRRPQLWVIYAVTILSTAAYMITFNYLAAILEQVTHLAGIWVPAVLALFGAGAFVGLAIGGRISDRHPHLALLAGAVSICALSLLTAPAAGAAWTISAVVFLLGVGAFVMNPAIYGRVFAVAADAPTLAGATTVSAFQLGISITPALAAIPLRSGAPPTVVALVGAALAAVTIPLIFSGLRLARKARV